MLLDIRSQKQWGQEELVAIINRHFSQENYDKHPILSHYRQQKEKNLTHARTSDLPQIVNTRRHLGITNTSHADLALSDCNEIVVCTDMHAARVLMAIDWQIIGLMARLRALERIRGETKQGLQWLTGFDSATPSMKSQATLSDKLALFIAKLVGHYYDRKDCREIAKIQLAINTEDESSAISAIVKLAEIGITRGVKLGYIVPRLTLLREVGHETRSNSLIFISAKCLAELSLEYTKYANEPYEFSACYSAGLFFLLEAVKHGPKDHSIHTDSIEELLKGALWCGLSANSLIPEEWNGPLSQRWTAT